MKFALNFKFDKVKLGMGLTCGVTTEFGQYTNFRSEAEKQNLIESEQSWILVTGQQRLASNLPSDHVIEWGNSLEDFNGILI